MPIVELGCKEVGQIEDATGKVSFRGRSGHIWHQGRLDLEKFRQVDISKKIRRTDFEHPLCNVIENISSLHDHDA